MRVFYYGVKDKGRAGHFLYQGNHTCRSYTSPDGFPCTQTPDAVFLPECDYKNLYKWYRWITDGWTIISCWDSSGDKRPGSNSNFIIEKVVTLEEAIAIATKHYPEIMKRINAAQLRSEDNE